MKRTLAITKGLIRQQDEAINVKAGGEIQEAGLQPARAQATR